MQTCLTPFGSLQPALSPWLWLLDMCSVYVSHEDNEMLWDSPFSEHIPQLDMINTIKGFSLIDEIHISSTQ